MFVSAPQVAILSGNAELTATTTDVFGNVVTNATISNTAIGAGTVDAAFGSYVTADKVYKATFTSGAVAGNAVVESKITASAVSGLPKPTTSRMSKIVVADLAGQVAVLQTKVATMVTAKKYNNLVVKYNKITRGKKAKLVK